MSGVPCQVCGQDTGIQRTETITQPINLDPEALVFTIVVYTCSAKCRDEIEASLEAASPNPRCGRRATVYHPPAAGVT